MSACPVLSHADQPLEDAIHGRPELRVWSLPQDPVSLWQANLQASEAAVYRAGLHDRLAILGKLYGDLKRLRLHERAVSEGITPRSRNVSAASSVTVTAISRLDS